MAGSSFGKSVTLTTFGESHGLAIGGILDGLPAGIPLDLEAVQHQLDRRRPGQSAITTQRKESDRVVFLSGLLDGVTTGTPLAFTVANEQQKAADYGHLKDSFRPSHADYTYEKKYGIRDHKGGGRSSARETVARVVAGAIAEQILATYGVKIAAYVDQVGDIRLDTDSYFERSVIDNSLVRCPNELVAAKMEALIREVRKEGDTIGGGIRCVVENVPPGWGEPVFDKLHAELGKAMLSINAVKGFEIGSGFAGIAMRGSEHNDVFLPDRSTRTNYSGGIQGGISNGMPIVFRVAFKPVATLMRPQESIDKEGKTIQLEGKGRHDPCVVPRAVPIVEAMTALVLLDQFLLHNARLNVGKGV